MGARRPRGCLIGGGQWWISLVTCIFSALRSKDTHVQKYNSSDMIIDTKFVERIFRRIVTIKTLCFARIFSVQPILYSQPLMQCNTNPICYDTSLPPPQIPIMSQRIQFRTIGRRHLSQPRPRNRMPYVNSTADLMMHLQIPRHERERRHPFSRPPWRGVGL